MYKRVKIMPDQIKKNQNEISIQILKYKKILINGKIKKLLIKEELKNLVIKRTYNPIKK